MVKTEAINTHPQYLPPPARASAEFCFLLNAGGCGRFSLPPKQQEIQGRSQKFLLMRHSGHKKKNLKLLKFSQNFREMGEQRTEDCWGWKQLERQACQRMMIFPQMGNLKTSPNPRVWPIGFESGEAPHLEIILLSNNLSDLQSCCLWSLAVLQFWSLVVWKPCGFTSPTVSYSAASFSQGPPVSYWAIFDF